MARKKAASSQPSPLVKPNSLPPIVTTPGASQRINRLVQTLANRRCEALTLYEPLPHFQPFHECRAPEVLLFGSNRAGKTLAGCIEIARAVTGQDPYGKYPTKDGRCYLVGFDGKHLGEVFHRKLFRAGAFQIIKDPLSGAWRAVRPKDPYDKANRHLWKPAPPLIPERFIKTKAWENKAQSIPTMFVLTNGWEIRFFSSKASPPQGMDIDIAAFDEEIENQLWYQEMAARLVDRNGRFMWWATPQAATDQLVDLYNRSQKSTAARVQSFFGSIYQNPYMDEEAISILLEKYPPGSPAHEVRILGKFAILGLRIYPEFEPDGLHGVKPFPIPPNWTRYAVIDPGHQVTAVLFAAIPPPEVPLHCYLYDELYLHNCDAGKFAEAMRVRCSLQSFEAFIIDHQMSRQTEVAHGRTIEVQYDEALAEVGVRSCSGGYAFTWGSPDVAGGIESVHKAMRLRKDGTPFLKVFKDKCPNLCDEFEKHRRKRRRDGTIEDVPHRKDDHLMSCVRMLFAYDPKYVKPRGAHKMRDPVLRALDAKKARLRSQHRNGAGGYVRLGPGSPS